MSAVQQLHDTLQSIVHGLETVREQDKQLMAMLEPMTNPVMVFWENIDMDNRAHQQYFLAALDKFGGEKKTVNVTLMCKAIASGKFPRPPE